MFRARKFPQMTCKRSELGNGKWSQQHSVDDTEDRGARTDPEGKRNHNHGRKAGLLH